MGHTPGPWKVSHDEHEPYWNIDMPRQDGSPGYGSAHGMVYTTEADAHLIAAAPELLAALQEAVTALNVKEKFPVYDTDSYAIAARCDKAIAKAEGRSE